MDVTHERTVPASGAAADVAPAPPREVWPAPARVVPFLVLHTAVWTLFPLAIYWPGSLPHDMTEAWAWGQELQLGYFKHPPFYAWLAGLWFQVLPRADWAFYLLAALVSAGGLWGVWLLAGRLIERNARWAAVLLLALGPFHGFMAINYNANSVLLLLWPWTAYFLVRAIETGHARHGAAFAAVAAAAVLSKYYSVILVAACALAALLHPQRRRIWRAPAPYVATAVGALAVAPHVWWLAQGGPTLTYAATRFGFEAGILLWKVAITGVQCLAYLLLPVLALAAALGRARALELVGIGIAGLVRPEHRWLAALAWGPYLLTLLAGTLGTVKISWNYLIPAFFLVPAATLAVARPAIGDSQLRKLERWVIGYLAIVLAAAPVAAIVAFLGVVPTGRQHKETAEPRREIALETNRLWHAAFDGAPLRIVASSGAWGHGIAFYAPDSPSDLTWFDMRLAPWVTSARLARDGLAIVCAVGDPLCLEPARPFLTPDTRRHEVALGRTWLGRSAPPTRFEIFLVPPQR